MRVPATDFARLGFDILVIEHIKDRSDRVGIPLDTQRLFGGGAGVRASMSIFQNTLYDGIVEPPQFW